MSIILRNISKIYNGKPVLKKIDLTLQKKSTTVLIGPSGCGKSTLIRIITGLIKPDTGSVLINNEELNNDNIQAVRRKIGYVIQDGGLFPHLSAAKNITLLPDYLKQDKNITSKKVKELCELTKFPVEALDRYPSEISGGQKQRVSLMRALMPDPEILLLDEPLGALDPLIRYDLQNDLKEIFRALHKTVVMVTHDLAEAAFFGDRIILMKEGDIIQDGSINEFIANPAGDFVTKFIRAQRELN